MPVLPTFDELYAAAKAEMQSRNPRLTDFAEGSNADAVAGASAVLADEVIAVAVDQFADQFVDTASGDALDALATDRFALSRKAASAAVGSLTFTRSAGVPTGVINIAMGTVCKAEVDGDEVTFTTDISTQIPDGDSTVDVSATCTETGSAGNVAAGVIDEVVSVVADDPDITVTNAARFTGGAAEETDPRFRDRIRRYYTTLRRGTVAALEAGALTVAGCEFAVVDESHMAPDDGGYVSVFIGDPDARASDELVDLVQTELEDWRAAGIWVVVDACEREEIALAVTISVLRGSDLSTIRDDVEENILAYIDALGPGATLRLARVQAAAIHVSPDVVDAAVTTPAADYAPTAANYAVRVPGSSLTITLVEVS